MLNRRMSLFVFFFAFAGKIDKYYNFLLFCHEFLSSQLCWLWMWSSLSFTPDAMLQFSLSQTSPVLFAPPPFSPPAPCFTVYCCGPVRLRSKHSWSLPPARPGQISSLCFLSAPSYFCWTSLWCSPPSYSTDSTVSSVVFYICPGSVAWIVWMVLVSFTCFHLVSRCLTEATLQ